MLSIDSFVLTLAFIIGETLGDVFIFSKNSINVIKTWRGGTATSDLRLGRNRWFPSQFNGIVCCQCTLWRLTIVKAVKITGSSGFLKNIRNSIHTICNYSSIFPICDYLSIHGIFLASNMTICTIFFSSSWRRRCHQCSTSICLTFFICCFILFWSFFLHWWGAYGPMRAVTTAISLNLIIQETPRVCFTFAIRCTSSTIRSVNYSCLFFATHVKNFTSFP